MTFRKDKRIDNSEPLKIWIWSLIGVFVFCLFSYVYLIKGSVVNIVSRQNMNTEMASLKSAIVGLESQYIKAKNDITPELSVNMGFIPVSDHKFVTNNVTKPGLSVLTTGN